MREKTCLKHPLTARTFFLKYLLRDEGNTLLNVAFPVVFNRSYCSEATWGYKHVRAAIWRGFWSSQTVPVVTHSCATHPRSVAGMARGPEHMLESFLLGCTSGCLLSTTSAAFPESRSDRSWLQIHSWHPSPTALLPGRPSLWTVAEWLNKQYIVLKPSRYRLVLLWVKEWPVLSSPPFLTLDSEFQRFKKHMHGFKT